MESGSEGGDPEADCECLGPPPEFRLPPPPTPYFMQGLECRGDALADFNTCEAVPVIDAELQHSPTLPSVLLITVCSVVLLLTLLLISALIWKHKRKMQNFLPCKSSPQNRCDVSGANGFIYEDLTNIHPRAMPNHCPPENTAPSIEMADVKLTQHYGVGFPPQLLGNASVFICSPPRNDPYPTQDLYNSVYEEVSNELGTREGSDSDAERGHEAETHGSEDDFAEDELSLPGDVTKTPRGSHVHVSQTSNLHLTPSRTSSFLTLRVNKNNTSLVRRSRDPRSSTNYNRTAERRPKSLDRRRWRNSPRNRPKHTSSPPPPAGLEPAAFHEGLILDALGPFPRGYMYSRGRSSRNNPPLEQQPAYHLPYSQTSYVIRHPHVNPYQSVSVLGLTSPSRPEMTSFRPKNKPKNSSSQDSFNSDSGFSNHTSGGRITTAEMNSSRTRNSEVYENTNMRPLHPLFS